jgi:putative Holliday junction resolvase
MGLALSDSLGLVARPLAIWERTNRRGDLARIRDLCRQHGVGSIVVGWPMRLDGTPGSMAGEAARFAERLHKHLGLPVELVDERLSSWEAARHVQEVGGSRRRRRDKALDDVAAAVILRDYLARPRTARKG